MRVGVQRRSVYLTPPMGMDRLWINRQFRDPNVVAMFGMDPDGAEQLIRLAQHTHLLVKGVIRRVDQRCRVGFALLFPPGPGVKVWEFGYVIPNALDRDAYTALHTMDAMAYYVFEVLKFPRVGGRTRSDNHAADAIARRAGHSVVEEREDGGHMFRFYVLEKEGWERRKARLLRGEELHPSSAGAAFRILPNPPFDPVQAAAPDDAPG